MRSGWEDMSSINDLLRQIRELARESVRLERKRFRQRLHGRAALVGLMLSMAVLAICLSP